MLAAEFGAKDADVQLANPAQVRALVDAAASSDGDGPGMSGMRAQPVAPEVLSRRLRDLGLAADVVVFTHLAPKTETGLLRGSNGSALAQADRIELQGDVTSVFKYNDTASPRWARARPASR